MFAWVKSLLGTRRPSPGELVRARALGAAQQAITARYDNAVTTDENQRNWWMADYLSAKSANSFQVRRQLRNRSRYEVSNNPFLFGVTNGHAADLVGDKGPTLKCLRASDAENRAVEAAWREWAAEVGLVEKVRTACLAEVVDGEGILVLKSVRDMECPVKLYPVDVEADQVTTPAPKNLQELWVDGLILHPVTGRPVAYDILKHHPGDYFFPNLNPLEVQRVKAKHVVFTLAKFRPGQVRGVPAFTPSLDMFSELRSYRKACLNKAQLSAQLTSTVETDAPAVTPDEEPLLVPAPNTSAPIDRGMQTVLPNGYHMKPYPTGEPSTTYEMFQEKCLGEAIRPLAYPLNLALGTSQKFNFSSARLDHVNYRNSLDVKRARYDTDLLDRLFRAWLEEAALVPGYLPASVRSAADVPHEWHWPGYQPLDPVADAAADHARLSNGTLTWREFWATRGHDWRAVLAQQAAEKDEIESLGLVFGDPLKKSDTVTEDAGGRGGAKGAEAGRAPAIEAYSPDQARDEDGKFGEDGTTEALQDRQNAERTKLEEKHDRERSGDERRANKEERVIIREEREIRRERQEHEREYARTVRRHDRERADAAPGGDVADRHAKEWKEMTDRHAREESALRDRGRANDQATAEWERRWASHVAGRDRRHGDEKAALDDRHAREQKQDEARTGRNWKAAGSPGQPRGEAVTVNVAAAAPPDLAALAAALREGPAPAAAESRLGADGVGEAWSDGPLTADAILAAWEGQQ